jgi:acyl-CoA hydrolase
VDLQSALRSLPANPRVVVSGNHAVPWHTLGLVDEALDTYRLWALNAPPGIPDREGVTLETSFVGPGMRKSPRLSYVPSRLSMVPTLFGTRLPPDMVVLHTTPPRDGKVSMGLEVNVLPAAVEAARRNGGVVIAQTNREMPWTFGDAVLDLDMIDVLVEADGPMPHAPVGTVDDDSATIGAFVSERVPDGATLQAGIGAVPDATMHGLTGRRGLRVWTEMFSDSVLALERAGALDRQVPLTASFLFGSPELLAWVDDNQRVEMRRTEVTNSPALIARNPAMVSVNTALQVDLFAQANASRINARIHSGFGGQTDFIVGAMHSSGGQAFIALRSWHPKADCSTIVPLVDEPVTSFQMTAVVTELGTAEIYGNDQREQARQLIENTAHPSVREELWEEAVALGLLRAPWTLP